MGVTPNYGLVTDATADALPEADGNKIDYLLELGVEGHHHRGALPLYSPGTSPGLTLTDTGGTLPGGNRIYYRWTLVDEDGQESAASPASFVDTTAGVVSPAAPTLATATTGGTLLPGIYFYSLSAYQGVNTVETMVAAAGFVTVPTGTSTNTVTLTLPVLPTGATGFNVYLRKPGQSQYFYYAPVDMGGATPPTIYLDDGSDDQDCDRGLPEFNGTNQTFKVAILLQEQPAVGYTWKLYRSFDDTNWTVSYVTAVTTTTGSTPLVVLDYLDTGTTAVAGAPPFANNIAGNPDKVVLTDGAEVDGRLPMGLATYPVEATFDFPGTQTVVAGDSVWVCEFPEATIIGCRANLGVGSVVSTQQLVVDVNKGSAGATPTFSTIYTTQANRPVIQVGQTQGARTTPDVVSLEVGDCLSVDVDQVSGTTEEYLVVTIYMIAHGYPEAVSFVDGTSTGV